MSNCNRKEEHFFEFVVGIAVLALIGCGVWFALKYVRHEKEAGSVSHQFGKIDEEAQKGGWVKDSNGAWSLPENVGTNATRPRPFAGETNNTAPDNN
jgi:hypothetical protein